MIYDRGASKIGKGLQSNCSLAHLSLPLNKVSGVGATALAASLRSNSVLTYLDLGQNTDVSSIAVALAQALESNCSLKYLFVNNEFTTNKNNRIGPK